MNEKKKVFGETSKEFLQAEKDFYLEKSKVDFLTNLVKKVAGAAKVA